MAKERDREGGRLGFMGLFVQGGLAQATLAVVYDRGALQPSRSRAKDYDRKRPLATVRLGQLGLI